MDKKIDLDAKTDSVSTDIKLKPNTKSSITLNKRISLDAPASTGGQNNAKKINITHKTKIITTSTNPNHPNEDEDENLEEELEDEEDDSEDDDDSDEDDSNDDDRQDDKDDKKDDKDDKKDDKKNDNKDQKNNQQNNKQKTDLDKPNNNSANNLNKGTTNAAPKTAAPSSPAPATGAGGAGTGAGAGASGAGAGASGAGAGGAAGGAGAAGAGGAAGGAGAAGAGGAGAGAAYVGIWVLIVIVIIIIISFIVALIITIFGYKQSTEEVQTYGTECTKIKVVNTDCQSDNTNCTNKYDGEVDFDEYIAGLIAANNGSTNNTEYFKVAAIINRTYVQKNIQSSCIVEGNSSFKKYIDIDSSSQKSTIMAAVQETDNMVLIKNSDLVDIDNPKKSFDKNTALNLISKSYTYEEVLTYFYGEDVKIEKNSTLVQTNKGFINPLKKFSCTSAFGKRIHPITNEEDFHTGLDMGGVPNGEPVHAAGNGKVIGVVKTVSRVGNCDDGYGNYVMIEHEDGIVTLYAHMKYDSIKDSIVTGYEVKRGEQIGQVGSTGCSSGDHLHYEISVNSKEVDPTDYMDLSSATEEKNCKKQG